MDQTTDWFFATCHQRLFASQMTEDSFNAQKNSLPYANRRGSIQVAYEALRYREIASGKHSFEEIPCAADPVGRQLAIPEAAYRADMSTIPHELCAVSSYQKNQIGTLARRSSFACSGMTW